MGFADGPIGFLCLALICSLLRCCAPLPLPVALVGLRSAARLYTLLNWWTRHRAVRTVNTATSWERLQCLSATVTVVEGHAGVRWHDFGRLITTLRARDCDAMHVNWHEAG